MPSVFSAYGYKFFFWSRENDEPIHIHICKGTPQKDATKFWLTRSGGCILEHNKSKISASDLGKIEELIEAHFFLICDEWKEHFKTDTINFYC